MNASAASLYPAPNPYLAGGHYPLTHYNMGATDIIRDPLLCGRFGVDLATRPSISGCFVVE